LERTVAACFDAESSAPARTAMQVVFTNGKLTLEDADVGQKWIAGDVEARIDIPADRKAPMKVTCQGQVADGDTAAKAQVALDYRSGRGGPGVGPQIRCDVTAERLPAAAAATFVRRFEPGLALDGALASSRARASPPGGWKATRAAPPSPAASRGRGGCSRSTCAASTRASR